MTVIKFDKDIQYANWELEELTQDMAQAREAPGLTRKLYTQEVSSCITCPGSLVNTEPPKITGECWLAGKLDVCLFREIDNLRKIPDWCPLEDVAKAGDPLAKTKL
jgi:hypothetical protein